MTGNAEDHWLLSRQVDTTRTLYEAECLKRESVRNSMAVPVAVLSFAAFGMGAVAANFEWSDTTKVALFLSWSVVVIIAIAVVCLLTALLILFFDGTATEADVRVTLAEVDANAAEIEDILITQVSDASGDAVSDAQRLRKEAISIAFEQLSDEYTEHTETLIAEVEKRLRQRRRVFAFAVPGFMLLIIAIALSIGI